MQAYINVRLMTYKKIIQLVSCCCLLFLATACNGIFGPVYDDEPTTPIVQTSQIYMNASSWQDWYYISFDSLERYRQSGDTLSLQYHQTHFQAYPIPMTPTGDRIESRPDTCSTGIYTYWYDVFGQGLSVNEYRAFSPTASQPEPEHWDLAIHYKDTRTNGGAVLETSYTSMDDLPASSAEFSGATFTPDEWSENVVWADQSQMLSKIIGCQGININKVLSSWLHVEIKSIPPTFTLNNHVFIIRLANGRYAAVQLENYLSPTGTRCWMTINYKYPY